MKDKEGGRTAAIEACKVAEKRLKESDAKLIEAERGRKSAEVVVDNAKRQAETQRKQLRLTEDELAASWEQIKLLKKKLEDVEKARDPLHSNSPQEGAKQVDPVDKEKKVSKEVTPKMTKPLDAPKDSSKEGMGSQNMKLVLATLPSLTRKAPRVRVQDP